MYIYVCIYGCTTCNLFATIKYEQIMKKIMTKKMIRNPSRLKALATDGQNVCFIKSLRCFNLRIFSAKCFH